ncbi:Arylsulfatase [Arenibacter antarcticus]|uniref:Arylsulfatase n=1 Tax=Arenibacter antarcticus TaxID=2040469 RepID=A0ABW5VGM3_9FLAO|nr:arylsulfatase [Arenibacter sp. H213]MCM4167125.1 sulfatase [Arenibacter sp. H213]
MIIKNIIKIILYVGTVVLAVSLSSCSVEKPKDKRPNIVLIMADDMGYSDIGCYGGEIATPNLDFLAAKGVRFTNFYNAAKCCPTRASLLTGVYHHEAGMGRMVSESGKEIKPGPYQGFLNNQTITLAEGLKRAGYATYMSGKWHVGERKEHWPTKRGFDQYFGLISGASSYYELLDQKERKRVMAYNGESWHPPSEGFYMTDAFTDKAISFISEHETKDSDQPFFLYLAYNAPHWPLHALPEDIAKYEGKYTIGWDEIRKNRFAKQLELGIVKSNSILSSRTLTIPSWDSVENKEDWAFRMQVYAAMVDRMDQGIGKVIKQLEKAGELDNTLIVFISDNGGSAENVESRNLDIDGSVIGEKGSYKAYKEPWANASNTPYRQYKNDMYEGGIASPCIVYWAKEIKESRIESNQFGHILDIMPTFLEVAGVDYSEVSNGQLLIPLKGQSILPVLNNRTITRDKPFYWEFAGAKAMRSGDMKLVKGTTTDWELYNLENDPHELSDLSAEKPGMVEAMKNSYQEWAIEVGVK